MPIRGLHYIQPAGTPVFALAGKEESERRARQGEKEDEYHPRPDGAPAGGSHPSHREDREGQRRPEQKVRLPRDVDLPITEQRYERPDPELPFFERAHPRSVNTGNRE